MAATSWACSERFSGLELRIRAQRSIYFILEIVAKKLYMSLLSFLPDHLLQRR